MAISRHDPEWQRVVAMAALSGATFERLTTSHKNMRKHYLFWRAAFPDAQTRALRVVQANSKYEVALLVLRHMGIDEKFLPDAASPQTAPSGPDGTELRSS